MTQPHDPINALIDYLQKSQLYMQQLLGGEQPNYQWPTTTAAGPQTSAPASASPIVYDRNNLHEGDDEELRRPTLVAHEAPNLVSQPSLPSVAAAIPVQRASLSRATPAMRPLTVQPRSAYAPRLDGHLNPPQRQERGQSPAPAGTSPQSPAPVPQLMQTNVADGHPSSGPRLPEPAPAETTDVSTPGGSAAEGSGTVGITSSGGAADPLHPKSPADLASPTNGPGITGPLGNALMSTQTPIASPNVYRSLPGRAPFASGFYNLPRSEGPSNSELIRDFGQTYSPIAPPIDPSNYRFYNQDELLKSLQDRPKR